MEEVKLTKEQEILFEVYDKGVQNEDCDLDAYVEKMKQALSIAIVSNRRELLTAFQKDYNKRNFEDALIADQDIELFLAAYSG